jgi:hypothetical protein
MLKNLGYYVLFFFILNIIVNAISGGEPNFFASLIYFILLGIWLVGVSLQKHTKTNKNPGEEVDKSKTNE